MDKKYSKRKPSLYLKYGKRTIDIVVSSVALAITLPINMFIGIGTYFDVGRPIFFRQERLGKDGKVFTLVKFRNMTNEVDDFGQLLPAAERVTRFGKIMRKTSLDELLNFWPILKGDMSLIGPRPLLVEYGSLYNDEHRKRMGVKPGLECPMLHRIGHPITWQEQFDNDVWYVENVSFSLDVRLFIRIVALVFDKNQTVERSKGSRGVFAGYSNDGIAVSFDDLNMGQANE